MDFFRGSSLSVSIVDASSVSDLDAFLTASQRESVCAGCRIKRAKQRKTGISIHIHCRTDACNQHTLVRMQLHRQGQLLAFDFIVIIPARSVNL